MRNLAIEPYDEHNRTAIQTTKEPGFRSNTKTNVDYIEENSLFMNILSFVVSFYWFKHYTNRWPSVAGVKKLRDMYPRG